MNNEFNEGYIVDKYPWLNTHLHDVNDTPLKTANHHLQRYVYAFLHAGEPKNILDIGCGSGYGSYLLGMTGRSVLGVDLDEEAVEYARVHFSTRNTFFLVFDALDMSGSYDLVTCFEFIEHVSKEDGERFLRSLKSLTRHFFLSTPVDSKVGVRVHHMSQWTKEDFRRLLGFDFTLEFMVQEYDTGVIRKPLSGYRENGFIFVEGTRIE